MFFKRMMLMICILGASSVSMAQPSDLEGAWEGALSSQGVTLRLILHISESSDGYEARLESVDQGRQTVPMEIQLNDESVVFTNGANDIRYTARVDGDQMAGEFNQMGNTMDLTLTRSGDE